MGGGGERRGGEGKRKGGRGEREREREEEGRGGGGERERGREIEACNGGCWQAHLLTCSPLLLPVLQILLSFHVHLVCSLGEGQVSCLSCLMYVAL